MKLYEGKLINNEYKLSKKIGSGSFGQIFSGTNINTNEEVAIKFEHSLTCKHKQLKHESQIYTLFAKTSTFCYVLKKK